MLLLPVIDIRGGLAVRGVGGDRHLYKPISSWLCESSDPLALASALRNRLGAKQLYVADLDAIERGEVDRDRVVQLGAQMDCLWIDVGCCDFEQFMELESIQRSCQQTWRIVVALESLRSPEILKEILSHASRPADVVFSLDMREGQLLGDESWQTLGGPIDVARFAMNAGCRSTIVLDLTDVGNDHGTSTHELIQGILDTDGSHCVIAGGGLRTVGDLVNFESMGVQFALVATAIHNRSLPLETLSMYL